ncbi:MAG: hypothetical protein KDA80_20150, partial [Planctomycetaceae bacterium]|nr:hypothetical protein [Planctomycetaceae bacterium]
MSIQSSCPVWEQLKNESEPMRVLFGLIVAGILFGMGSILTKAQESSELALQPIPDASLQDSE